MNAFSTFITCFSLAHLACLEANAAEIHYLGKTFKNAKVISVNQETGKVMLKHDEGINPIPHAKLPANLQKKHPFQGDQSAKTTSIQGGVLPVAAEKRLVKARQKNIHHLSKEEIKKEMKQLKKQLGIVENRSPFKVERRAFGQGNNNSFTDKNRIKKIGGSAYFSRRSVGSGSSKTIDKGGAFVRAAFNGGNGFNNSSNQIDAVGYTPLGETRSISGTSSFKNSNQIKAVSSRFTRRNVTGGGGFNNNTATIEKVSGFNRSGTRSISGGKGFTSNNTVEKAPSLIIGSRSITGGGSFNTGKNIPIYSWKTGKSK